MAISIPHAPALSFGRLRKRLLSRAGLRAIVSLAVFLALWEFGSRSKEWLGYALPWVGRVPAPSAVVRVWSGLLTDCGATGRAGT